MKNNHIVTRSTAIDMYVGYMQAPSVPIVENNVIEARSGVYVFVQAFGGGMEVVIRKNTFIGPGAIGTGSAGIMYRMHQEARLVSNNIITNFEYGWLLTYHSKEAERMARFNYNNGFGNGDNYSFSGDESFNITGTQGNTSADPLSVDRGNGDYHLVYESPMIDAGWNAGVLTDINGNGRPVDVVAIDNNGTQPEFDISAFKYTVPEPSGSIVCLAAAFALYAGKRNRLAA